MGVAPSMWMNRIDQSVAQMLAPFQKQAAAPAKPRSTPPGATLGAPTAMARQQAITRHLAATSFEKTNQVNGR
jgi:hypothetical protein